MKQAPLIVAAAICAALTIFGVVLWISVPETDESPPAAHVEASPQALFSTGTAAAPLPFAESGPIRDIDFPAAAARALNGAMIGEERTIAMRTVFREWAGISPQDALAWIATMDVEQDRNEAREFVCHRVAEDDPKLAFDLARQSGADTATPLVRDLAQQWAAKDADSAGDWALALPAGADRDEILARVCQVLSQSDPSAAGALVSREIPAGPAQDEAAMSVLHQWAIRDFTAASEWVESFPEGPLRTRAEEELAGIREYQAGADGTE